MVLKRQTAVITDRAYCFLYVGLFATTALSKATSKP